eukprot:Skav218102  [mRNA]  locus=scaffold759:61921:63735:- [translate_table: standard]
MALLPWALLCMVLHVEANWEIGDMGQTCDEACTAKSGTCSQDGNRQLNSNFEFDYVFEDLVTRSLIPSQYYECDSYQRLTDAAVQAQPGTIYFADPDLVRPICYQYSDESTCSGSADGNAYFRRICCCLPNPTDDYSTACFVPTTTTSTATTETTTSVTTISITTTSKSTTGTTTSYTQTKTSSTTKSSTTTTATSTSQTDTTFTSTSSTATTIITGTSSTVTSSSSTGTTVTTTRSTTTTTTASSTMTTSSTITSSMTTTTVVTLTSTSFTATSSSTISTTSTTTVTEGAQTLITAFVPAGSYQIPIADRTGFSEGDMILLRGREVVQIDNITEDEERRLDGDGRRLSGAIPATLEVIPDIQRDYNPGDSMRNLGSSSTYAGSDPITFHGGQKIKFWLQSNQEFMILETAELKVFGEVFPGPKSDLQWFGKFRVVLSDNTPVVEVHIKRQISNYTRVSSCSSRRIDSMDVFVGRAKSLLREVQRRPMHFAVGDEVRFAIDCRQQNRPLLASSRTEFIHFETPSIVFLIVAAHAGNEFPDDWRLQLKYMHLDLLILEMPRKNEFKGILPEIWGLLPRSPEVEAMLSPPQAADEIEQCCPGCCNA